MIIDNPHVMREVIEEISPYFTHPGAEEIYTTRCRHMDAYAKKFAELADPVWQNEYMKHQQEVDNSKGEKLYPVVSASVQRDLLTGI
jgi:hypothetical protein